MKKTRPKNLDLMSIRMPANALVSILHRASGFILFLAIPMLLLMFQWSLSSVQDFTRALTILGNPVSKLILIALTWAFAHHFLAGLRHLAMDVHWGTQLGVARITSKAVLAGACLITIGIAARLWG